MRATACLVTWITVTCFAVSSGSVAGTKTTSSWAAADLKAGAPGKYLVLARFSEESAKRILEDAFVKKLRDAGVEAVAAYQTLTAEDLADENAIKAKAEQLGVTSGIVFTVTGESTKVKSGSRAHASVGVPVRVGPFSTFVGTSVPLGGGPSTVKKVEVKAELHIRDASNPRWIATFATDLQGGADRAAAEIATQSMKQLRKAGLFR